VAPAIVPEADPFLDVEPAYRPDGRVVIGYMGRLVPEKGLQWLLCALDGLANVELLVVGSGPYESQLRRQAKRRGIAAVFAGSVEPKLIPEILSEIDVLVVPSVARPGWAEQFGRVVCEAMFARVPVVTSDSGSLSEVVGDGGIVVPELSHQELHTALVKLVTDERERDQWAARGRQWALANLGPEVAARRLIELWQGVQSGR
jgi:glycosyltransferase involved in cell wall biosynthesis